MSGLLRRGRHNPHTIYEQAGSEPSDSDTFVGTILVPGHAQMICDAVNMYANTAGVSLHRIERLINEWGNRIMNAVNDIAAATAAVSAAANTMTAIGADLQEAALNIQAQIATLVGQGADIDTGALNAAVDNLNRAVAPLQQAQAAVDALETPAA